MVEKRGCGPFFCCDYCIAISHWLWYKIFMSNISPKVDIAFKKIFGVEENKDLLMSLINSIVSEADQVTDITLLNPYNPKNFINDKLSILDVKAKGQDGKRFNIEIQISDAADYDKRALYYWAKLYTEQLQESQDYGALSKAIGIHILNFLSIPESPKYHNVFRITEKDTGIDYFKDLELHTIELGKFTSDSSDELSDLIAKVKNSLDVWLAFLTRHDLLKVDVLPKEFNNPNIRKALDVLEVMGFTDVERELYEGHLKFLRMEFSTLKKAKEDGWAEGLEEGREEGREENKIETATKMLAEGISIKVIAKCTGLSEAVIASLAP